MYSHASLLRFEKKSKFFKCLTKFLIKDEVAKCTKKRKKTEKHYQYFVKLKIFEVLKNSMPHFLGLRKFLILRSTDSVSRFFKRFFVHFATSSLIRNFVRHLKNFDFFSKRSKDAWEYTRDHKRHHSRGESAQIKKILKVFMVSTLGFSCNTSEKSHFET